jgi:hypothetical protein
MRTAPANQSKATCPSGRQHIIPGVSVTPPQPLTTVREHLLHARDDEEVLGVVVAVLWHGDSGGTTPCITQNAAPGSSGLVRNSTVGRIRPTPGEVYRR